MLHGQTRPRVANGRSTVSLLGLLRIDRTMRVAGPLVIGTGHAVRFDADSGELWVGATRFGKIPVGSKEYHFLRCLAARTGRFVPYADIKRFVQGEAGSTDSTDEATFRQGLKSRIKRKKWVADIDRLIATTNKGDGYRLRGQLEP